MSRLGQSPFDPPMVFYSDCYDENGNKIAEVTMTSLRASWLPEPIPMVKVHPSEIVLPEDSDEPNRP